MTLAPPCEACGEATAEARISAMCVLWRCPRCGHVLRDLARCRAGARAHPWGGSEALDRVRLALTRQRLRTLLPGRTGGDVLEVGFGRGLLLASLLAEGHRVSGVDPGALGLDLAPSLARGATIYPVPVEDASLPAGRFDLVYGIHVVEHLRDPAIAFGAWHRALRPGGRLYLITPNARSAGLSLFRDRWWNLEDPTHVRFFSPASIGLMLEAAGFEGIRWRAPVWDSLTMEVSSVLRTFRNPATSGDHGVLGGGPAWPAYALGVPLALIARFAWPAVRPSMEVMARRPS